jgi:NAD(P)-dependent dehydrogenase (short-subunit alcohol dehydrogenase family)
MFSLAGKIAIVTGAASGIGLAIAERFRAAGAIVTGIDRTPAEHCVVADVSDEKSLATAFDAVVAEHGRLDIVVNNAGIQPLGVDFANLTSALLNRTFAVNVHGVALGIKHAARYMTSGGRIVNTGSFVGTVGVPHGTAYAASKAAVIHLTRCAAVELAPRGITVNCVCPGTVATPAVLDIPDNPEIPFAESRTPLGRLATSGEIAAAFHFLASDEAAYITGAILPVDGGITAGWERYDLVAPSNVVNSTWIE